MLTGPALFTTVQYSIAFCSQTAAASGVISSVVVRPIIPDKYVKFRELRLNRSREIPSDAIGGGIYDAFLRDNVRPEVVSDVIPGAAVVGRYGCPMCKMRRF